MIKLIEPNRKYLEQYQEAYLLSLKKIKLGKMKDHDLIFSDLNKINIIQKTLDAKDDKKLKNGYVPAYYFFLIDNDKFIGEIHIRIKLTSSLLNFGGNISYGINPKYWNMGYGNIILKLGLEKIFELGINSDILITCDDDNIASSKIIEKNGGKLENIVKNNYNNKEIITRRYWISLSILKENFKKNRLKLITIADNESFLRQISDDVDIDNDNELKKDVKVLEDFCKSNEVMAMAAIQLGIPKRLVYLKNTNLEIINKMQSYNVTEEEKNYNEARVLINPKIIKKEGLTEYWEACASCLDNCGRVLRPYKMLVEYYDMNKNKYQDVFEGFESTVLAHEIDHLDGILHMDIALEILVMTKEKRKTWRKRHGYKIHSKTGNYDDIVKNKILSIKGPK